MFTKVAIQLALVTILGSASPLAPVPAWAQAPPPRPSVFQTTLEEPNQKTPEITTEQLQAILKAGLIPVFDVRTAEEYAIAHIPGSINIYEKEVEHILEVCPPDRDAQACPEVLPGSPGTLLSPRMICTCDGRSCGKSKRTSDELLALGSPRLMFRGYQLGLPGLARAQPDGTNDTPGLLYIFTRDHTSVFVDARTPAEYADGTIPGAVNVQKGGSSRRRRTMGGCHSGTRARAWWCSGTRPTRRWSSAPKIAASAHIGAAATSAARLATSLAAGLIDHPPVVLAKNAIVAAGGVHGSDTTPPRSTTARPSTHGDSLALFGASRHAAWPRRARRCSQRHRRPRCVEIRQCERSTLGLNGAGDRAARHDIGRPQRYGWVPVTLDYAVSDNCGTATTTTTVRSWLGSPHDGAGVIHAHHLLLRAGMVHGITDRRARRGRQ